LEITKVHFGEFRTKTEKKKEPAEASAGAVQAAGSAVAYQ
jgi:hypothetical protein